MCSAIKKYEAIEETLIQERRDHAERCQALLSDLMNERGVCFIIFGYAVNTLG